MAITTPISSVGIIRATEMLQSARNEAIQTADDDVQIMTVSIGRSVDAPTPDADDERPLPPSQDRVVDIRV